MNPSSTCTRAGTIGCSHRSAPSPGTQIIVATHSPEVVMSALSYERFTLGDTSRFKS